MYKKVLFLGLAIGLLGGCDTGESDNKVEQVQQEQIAPKASSTAIFLPGGGGIDYGVALAKDRRGFNDEYKRPTRAVTIYLNERLLDVVEATTIILEEQGYKAIEKPHKKHQKHYIYTKDNKRISIAYNEVYREGFSKQTSVFFWYWDDQ